jgi:hypothetical protein
MFVFLFNNRFKYIKESLVKVLVGTTKVKFLINSTFFTAQLWS